jgi:hypothetical protein
MMLVQVKKLDTSQSFDQSICHYTTDKQMIKPFLPWQNKKAESGIHIIKSSKWKWHMVTRKVPKRLWDFALIWIAQIYS